ncbi:hypothetical protein WAC31_29035, partial [Klebsiella pneumoniae]
QGVGTGLRYLGRDFVQFGRVEAHRARHRLAMDEAAIGLHQTIGCARGDFDMIAEHAIVTDLELGDAGPRAIVGLERGDRAPAAR